MFTLLIAGAVSCKSDNQRSKPDTDGVATLGQTAGSNYESRAPQITPWPGEGRFLVFVGASNCSISRRLEPTFRALESELGENIEDVTFKVVDADDGLPGFVEWPINGRTPWVVAVEDGEMLDGQFGGANASATDASDFNRKQLMHLLARNGWLRDHDPTALLAPVDQSADRRPWGLKRLRAFALSGMDFSGANFERADLSSACLSGSNLRGANLTGATLSRAILARADLRGADIEGANFDGAVFLQTRCPDGYVTTSGETCDGHSVPPVEAR